jgi:hypothetical protein
MIVKLLRALLNRLWPAGRTRRIRRSIQKIEVTFKDGDDPAVVAKRVKEELRKLAERRPN